MNKKLHFLIPLIRTIYSIRKAYKNDFGTLPRPIALHFETTYMCTCKCVFCSRWIEGSKKVKQELTYDQIIDLIDQSYTLGVRLITLSGGEPLLKKGIIDAMKYARSKGIITNITHNGTLINEKNVRDVLSAFDIINISLDSLKRKKHDDIRGVAGTFDKVMESIRLLKEYSKNTVINVQSVLTAKNSKDILEINKELSKKGVNTYFQPIHNIPDNNLEVREKEYNNFNIGNLKKQSGGLFKEYKYPSLLERLLFKSYYEKSIDFIINPLSTKKCFTCFAGSFSFFVDPYGEVFPCDPLRTSMGNVKENTLKEIWASKKNICLKKKIKNRNCNCWLLCSAPIYINLSKVIKSRKPSLFTTH